MFIWGPLLSGGAQLNAVTAIDLVAAEGSQDQAGDNAALEQLHILAPAEGVQTQLGDNADLTQVHALVPAEGAQDQSGDNAVLEVVIVLVPAEGSQDQAGDNAALTQVHVLVPAEGAQEQAGDNAALTQVHALVPAEGVQDQAGDSPSLTQVHVLAPAEGAQDQAGDGADLTQVHVLAPAEGFQTQLGDEATIEVFVPAIDLYAQGGVQDQLGDGAALTQTHIMAPDEGVQEQFGDEATLGLDLPIDLQPYGGDQEQAGDTPALTQVHNLETQEPELMVDGGLEDWIDANNLRYWTETGAGGRVTRDAGAYAGSYCARLHYVSMDTVIGQFRTLQKEREYRMRFMTKCPGTTGSDFLELWITTQFVGEMMPRYLQWDGSWENGGFIFVPVFDSWEPFEQFFTLPAQSNGSFGVEFHWASANDCLVDAVTMRLTDAARQTQAGDTASLIVGVLKTYEFVDRLLLEERIKARRLAERTVRLNVEDKVEELRVGRMVERARVHNKTKTQQLGRFQ